jgi:hypothetical protein
MSAMDYAKFLMMAEVAWRNWIIRRRHELSVLRGLLVLVRSAVLFVYFLVLISMATLLRNGNFQALAIEGIVVIALFVTSAFASMRLRSP